METLKEKREKIKISQEKIRKELIELNIKFTDDEDGNPIIDSREDFVNYLCPSKLEISRKISEIEVERKKLRRDPRNTFLNVM